MNDSAFVAGLDAARAAVAALALAISGERMTCEVCNRRPAIKTGSHGWECHHCAAGLSEPITGPSAPRGRNDPCHCGSGRKFKRCCLKPKA